MKIAFSSAAKGVVGISGHAGVGHVHSHSGFVQDDSAGLAVAVSILKEALPLSTTIDSVAVSLAENKLTVYTEAGGVATASPRQPFTPAEKELLESRAPGLDAAYCQNVAVQCCGRLYGQGVSETAACLEGAAALAVLDGFYQAAPQHFHLSPPAPAPYLDRALTTVLDIDGLPVALQLLVNFTAGGLGPAEDYEGNYCASFKQPVMEAVGLDKIPTVVLESKAYIPSLAPGLEENTLLLRAQRGVDRVDLAQCLQEAAAELQLPCLVRQDLMPLTPGALREATAALAAKVQAVAAKLAQADTSAEKVALVAELATLVREEAGGISFMSNSLHDQVRGAGLVAGSGCVLSLLCCQAYKDYYQIPLTTVANVAAYKAVTLQGLLTFYRQCLLQTAAKA